MVHLRGCPHNGIKDFVIVERENLKEDALYHLSTLCPKVSLLIASIGFKVTMNLSFISKAMKAQVIVNANQH